MIKLYNINDGWIGSNFGAVTIKEAHSLISAANSHIQKFKNDESVRAFNKRFMRDHQQKLSDDLNKSIKEKSKQSGYIYLMLDEVNGFIKIGYSKNPLHRERTLQSEKPTIKLIFKAQASLKFEKEMHEFFSEYRVRGEWFNVEPNVIIEIIDSFDNKII